MNYENLWIQACGKKMDYHCLICGKLRNEEHQVQRSCGSCDALYSPFSETICDRDGVTLIPKYRVDGSSLDDGRVYDPRADLRSVSESFLKIPERGDVDHDLLLQMKRLERIIDFLDESSEKDQKKYQEYLEKTRKVIIHYLNSRRQDDLSTFCKMISLMITNL